MNLRHLEVFRHVMQTGTVKGAAAVLSVSEAAASKLLSTAERRMNLRLFERAHGRLIPTPEAHRLYEDVEQLWGRVERIEALTKSLAKPTEGHLKLAVAPSFGVTVVPQATTRLLGELPGLTVNVDLLIPHLLLESLIDGSADLGVTLNPRPHPSLEVCARSRCDLLCAMPKGHPLASRKVVHAADLEAHAVVSFPQARDYGISDDLLFGANSASIRRPLNVRSGQTACWFSLAGAGVAIVDSAAVAGNAFPDLELRPYRCDATLEVLLLKRRDRPLSRPAELFCEAFRQTWASLADSA